MSVACLSRPGYSSGAVLAALDVAEQVSYKRYSIHCTRAGEEQEGGTRVEIGDTTMSAVSRRRMQSIHGARKFGPIANRTHDIGL